MRGILIIVSVFISFNSLSGQVSFDEYLLLEGNLPGTTTTMGNHIKIVDMDIDGDDDVVVAAFDRVVGWYENIDGNGNFGNLILIDDRPREVVSLDVKDINGDGMPDVIISSSDNECVTWYENKGGGVIASEILYIDCNHDQLVSAFALDMDIDGDQDVVFASTDNGRIVWVENTDGLGNFGDPNQLYFGSQQNGPTHFAAFDLDENGVEDIVVGGANSLYIYYNDGLGSTIREVLDISPSGTRPVHTFADYDGDGDMDIVTGVNNIEWLENGANGFMPAKSIYDGRTSYLLSGDIDLDGDIDIITLSDVEKSLVWLENIGTQSDPIIHPILEGIEFPQLVNTSDLDLDGDLDLVISVSDGILIQLMNEDGAGNFIRGDDVNPQLGWLYDLHSADLDGDGDIDAISADNSNDRIDWYENVNGDGQYMKQHNITYFANGASAVISADLDHDGDLDVLACSTEDFILAWYENLDGLGDYGPQKVISSDFVGGEKLEVVDVDGDGYRDIVALYKWGTTLGWIRNIDGQANFDDAIVIHGPPFNFTASTISDIDGDGDIDIVVAQEALTKIYWTENLDGKGDFSFLKVIAEDIEIIKSLHSSDVDGDFDQDIIFNSDRALGWCENINGIGNFTAVKNIDKLIFSQAKFKDVTAKDIDGDGDEDVIAVSNDGLFWYENHGYSTGRWSQATQLKDGYLDLVHSDDFSGSGVNDILVFSLSDNYVSLFANKLDAQNYISGHVLLNLDDTCAIENPPVSDIFVSSTDGVETYSSFTNKSGRFLNRVPFGNYTSSISTIPSNYTEDPTEISSIITEDAKSDTLLFCLTPISEDTIIDVNDLVLSMFPANEARPGFDVTYQLVYRNLGTTTLSDSLVLYFPGNEITYLSASKEPASVIADSIIWVFDGLKPFETRKINVKFNIQPPPIVDNSTVLRLMAKIHPINSDKTPLDNVVDLRDYVVGSFDPNDINVLEGPEIEYNDYVRSDTLEYLNYVIRFQNTGTASAINIRVANILDPNLDWSTFQPISSSHEHRIEIINRDSVNFIFEGIYLPDSTTDLENSQGFITYRIQPKDDLVIGDIIYNDAEIYFDFNEPIYTNIVTTEIINTVVGTSQVQETPEILVYPSLTDRYSMINGVDMISNINIFYPNGDRAKVIENSKIIDLQGLPSGLYIIHIMDQTGHIYNQKIFKLE